MPRKPRIISSSGIYHIILRSVNQQIIFEEDSDYQKFLFILSDCKDKFEVDIYAYCLMSNHIHLLIHATPQQMSRFFKSFGARFVLWYNKKYSRTGHLFQDRYYSRCVEDDRAYLCTLIYIHNNPVKANMCRYPSEHRWSSYNAYHGAPDKIIKKDFSFAVAGSQPALLHFFREYETSEAIEQYAFEDGKSNLKNFVTDEQALTLFYKLTKLKSLSESVGLPLKKRNEFIRSLNQNGLTYCQISRLMAVSPTTVARLCKK